MAYQAWSTAGKRPWGLCPSLCLDYSLVGKLHTQHGMEQARHKSRYPKGEHTAPMRLSIMRAFMRGTYSLFHTFCGLHSGLRGNLKTGDSLAILGIQCFILTTSRRPTRLGFGSNFETNTSMGIYRPLAFQWYLSCLDWTSTAGGTRVRV